MSDTATLKERMIEKFKRDRFAMYVGIEILEVAPGYAKTKLEVKDQHFNGVDIVQGGAIFTLADFAFAVASNTGEATEVAIETNLSFLKPTRSGVLFAEAKETYRSKSLASYEVPITNEKGEVVARFYGRSFVRNARPTV